MKNRSCRKFLFLIPLIVLGALVLLSLAVFALWNGVLTDVFDVKSITYWQALGLLVLARILFGGFPGRRGGPFGAPWRKRMLMERWQSMTREKREELQRRLRDRPKAPWCDPGLSDEKGPEDAQKT